jgi:hypothetical protein
MFHRTLLVGFVLLATACSSQSQDAQDSDDELRVDRGDHPWLYAGALPALESPEVHISLDAATARVTGFAPADFDPSTLPFYARATQENGRTRLTVVYPVASGQATNSPGEYSGVRATPFTPSRPGTAWGGFPFLAYDVSRGIAMHGPITAKDSEWHLIRGPVSHGCNRMQGEHVVEVAQLLGIDMRQRQTSHAVSLDDVKVSVLGYDPKEEHVGPPKWDRAFDKYVDVDYPALASVRRPPAAESVVYPTWDSRDFPRIVCAYRPNGATGPGACDFMPENKKDLKTGR